MIAETVLICIIIFFSCGGALCYPRTNTVLLETPSSSPLSSASRGSYSNNKTGADSSMEYSCADDPVDVCPPAYVDVVDTSAKIHPLLHVRMMR